MPPKGQTDDLNLKGDYLMYYVYGYFTDFVCADSYEEAYAYFAARYEDFDPDEVWVDTDSDC